MAIKVGDRLPSATFMTMTAEGPKPQTTDEIFKGKKVVLFAVPGAFTPTCDKNHLPGFLTNADKIKGKGIDTIAVTGVNDVFVMNAWKKASGAEGKVEFLADGSGEVRQCARPHRRPRRARARHPLAALLHGGRGRRGEDAQHRGRARQGRRLRRGESAEGAVSPAAATRAVLQPKCGTQPRIACRFRLRVPRAARE